MDALNNTRPNKRYRGQFSKRIIIFLVLFISPTLLSMNPAKLRRMTTASDDSRYASHLVQIAPEQGAHKNHADNDDKQDLSTYRDMLFRAIAKESLDEVRQIYRSDAVVYSKFGATPLYFAVQKGKLPIVSFLITNDDNVNRANLQKFKTSSQVQQRKENSLASNHRAVGITLSLDSLTKKSKEKCETIAPRTRAQSDGEKSKRRHKVSDERMRASAVALKIAQGTPIFALVGKEVFTDDDIAIADLLIAHDADLNYVDAQEKNPVEILEKKLEKAAQKSVLSTPRNQLDFALIRNIYLQALENSDLKNLVFPLWFVFADSHTTARLLEIKAPHNRREREADKKFYELISNWQLDAVLPSPRDAFDRYQQIKRILPIKIRFKMLLQYLYLSKQNKKEHSFRKKSHKITSTTTIAFTNNAGEVAKAIRAVHCQLFLSVDPKNVLVQYTRNESEHNLLKLIQRHERLSNYVSFSIVTSEKREDQFDFWRRVAKKLLKSHDLFGASSIITALKSSSVTRLISTGSLAFPDLSDLDTYLKLRNDSIKSGLLIPHISLEGKWFEKEFERLIQKPKIMFVDVNDNIITLIQDFMASLTKMQNLLKSIAFAVPEPLFSFFWDLPGQSKANAAELMSLQVAGEKKSTDDGSYHFMAAENWDTEDLWQWLKNHNLSHLTNLLTAEGITDGPSFLEKFAIARSARYGEIKSVDVHGVFSIYAGICRRANYEPLGDLLFEKKFPVNLLANPTSTFHWIMWLRNNQLSKNIIYHLENYVDNFQTLMERMLKQKLILPEGNPDITKIAQLKDLYLAINQRPENVRHWKTIDVDAWIFQHGLTHIIKAIIDDIQGDTDYFLSYLFVTKNFSLKLANDLGINPQWLIPASEAVDPALFQAFLEDAQRTKIASLVMSEKDWTSPLTFIRVLLALDAKDSIAHLYREKIQTLKKFKKRFFPTLSLINENTLVKSKVGLAQLGGFGLDKKQIAQLKPLLGR